MLELYRCQKTGVAQGFMNKNAKLRVKMRLLCTCRPEQRWSASTAAWWPSARTGRWRRWETDTETQTVGKIRSQDDHPPSFLQDDDKNFRRAPSWRKKFRPKDMRGMSLGASDTLPANFRVTSSSAASPSAQPKRSPMDGKRQEPSFSLHVSIFFWLEENGSEGLLGSDYLCCSWCLLNGFAELLILTNGMSLHAVWPTWQRRRSVYTEAGHCHSQDLLLLTQR